MSGATESQIAAFGEIAAEGSDLERRAAVFGRSLGAQALDDGPLAADARGGGVTELTPYLTDGGRINAPQLAAYLRQETPTAIGGTTLHVYLNGGYLPGEDHIAARIHELAGDKWTRHLSSEVIGNLRAGSPALDEQPPLDRINVANGIYNLNTGALEPHTPALLSPVQLPVTYDPEATCPHIEQFLANTLKPSVATLFIEVAALLLTPDNGHQRAFLFKGPGGGGKTTALEVMSGLIGERNVSRVALQQLDEHRFATAQLYGRLANIHADLPSRAVNSTSTFKCITGGDPIMAERKGRDPFTFRAYARFVFSANETPPTHDGSEAYFDRWTILPFTRTFRGTEQQDRHLIAKLTTPAELSGLLNLALATIADVRRRGFTIGKEATAEHERFRLDSDPVAAFLDERCTLDPNARTTKADLYSDYRAWCIDTGRTALAARRFTGRIRDRYTGTVDEVTVNGKRIWNGLALTGSNQ